MSESNGSNPELKVFDTGMVRSMDAEEYSFHLLSPIAKRAWARAYREGEKKYNAFNCEKGAPALDFINHAENHINDWLSGCDREDHLGHAMWNIGMAIHSMEMWPHLNSQARRKVGDQLNVPPNVDDATVASWRTFSDRMDRLREEFRKDSEEDEIAEGDKPVNLIENLRRMKEGVKAAAIKPRAAGEDIRPGDVITCDDDSRFRKWNPQAAPSRVLRRYHFMPAHGLALRCAQYRADLQFEGHEVVSRWIDNQACAEEMDSFDLHSCDEAIVMAEGNAGIRDQIRKACRFGKAIVAVGEPCPDDFPDYFRPERWFPNWNAFMNFLVASRNTAQAAR